MKLRKPKLSGVSDEAGRALATQIDTFRLLGWSDMELRTVDGRWIADLSDDELRAVRVRINDAGMRVSALSSRIGGWQRPISCDFAQDQAELRCLSARAQLLGTSFIRVMSYPNDGKTESGWRRASLARVRALAEMAEDLGVTLLHENCSGWAAQGALHARAMLEEIDSPALRLVLDFGNCVHMNQDALEYVALLSPFIRHVHLKDAICSLRGDTSFVEPGHGDAKLKEGIQRLVKNGYRGFFSIEPHVLHQPHLGLSATDDLLQRSFIEYGRSAEELVASNFENTERPGDVGAAL